ncbi:LOW QUALITY PROTEIN: uncharacterized protein LOC110179197 [Drosophila serrata]|uniref:LOW QUALITY PROTEIN: uncharacterized protein LOC110179197 n=1 Tax=Drosophila serrata TaxID=7274 RepID=UPI000A1D0BA9|nr:LOW QUALITY PROTEIN: uncharacterized protein LOC110179197 [Drosophila serrata]
MIFLQFWWALLVFNSLGSNSWPMNGDQPIGGDQQLESFSRAVDEAGPELQDLWSSFGDLPELDSEIEHRRERRNADDRMLTDFGQLPVEGSKAVSDKDKDRNWQAEADAWYENLQLQMAKRNAAKKRMIRKQERSLTDTVTEEDMRILGAQADAWYRDLMANRGKGGFAQQRRERSSRLDETQTIDIHDLALKRSVTGKSKPKKAFDEDFVQKQMENQSPYQAKMQFASSRDNVKLKQSPQLIGQQANLQAQNRMKVNVAAKKINEQLEKLHESRNAPDSIYESNRNYQAYPQAKSNELDHEANYKLSKIEQEASEKMPKLPKAIGQDMSHFKQKKRHSTGVCDPMEEIKLKTSSRLIAKGFGPLLPSETFELSRRGKLDEWQNRMLDATHDKNLQYQRLKNLEHQMDPFDYTQSKSSSAMDADLPQTFEYKDPESYRLYSLDQQRKPNVLNTDRTKRKPMNVNIENEANLRTSSLGQGLSYKQADKEPVALEGQMKINRVRSPSKQRRIRELHSTGWISRRRLYRDHESKEMVQKFQQEYHRDSSNLYGKPVTYAELQPSAIIGRGEEKLNADSKAVAPTINLNSEATSMLHDNQETMAHRVPRRTRRVKRSLEGQHVAARRRAQLLNDFEDHNANRVSFGVLGNGLLTPDADELEGSLLTIPEIEVLAFDELQSNHQDPINNLVSVWNQGPNTIYHHHEPLQSSSHKSNFKADTNFSQMSDMQKYLQMQQDVLQVLFEIFRMNEDLLDPTKFKPKTQVAKMLLRQYQDLPLVDQVVATDLLIQDLDGLFKTADHAVHQHRDAYLYKVLDDVLEEYKISKPSSDMITYLKVAEVLKDENGQKSWDPLAF